ncbi:hypothetical protein EDC96DRAFT_549687 [Choanephora cucurbitarum]|nr:hypothetical protein EDC96DRAFT_549687 [Choanephora cucurbitarum]
MLTTIQSLGLLFLYHFLLLQKRPQSTLEIACLIRPYAWIDNRNELIKSDEDSEVSKAPLVNDIMDRFYDEDKAIPPKLALNDLIFMYSENHQRLFPWIPIESVKSAIDDVEKLLDDEAKRKVSAQHRVGALIIGQIANKHTLSLMIEEGATNSIRIKKKTGRHG